MLCGRLYINKNVYLYPDILHQKRGSLRRPFFITNRGSSSSGRAFGSQSKGSGFESHLLHKKRELRLSFFFVVDGPNVRVVGWADGTPRVPSTPQKERAQALFFLCSRWSKCAGCRLSRRHTSSPIYSTKKERAQALSFFFVVDGPIVRVVGWADGTPRVPSTPHPPQVAPLSLAAPLSCYLLANSLPTSRYFLSSTASSTQNLGWFFPRQSSP